MKYEENVWYGWNGGECPVHPLTEIEYVYLSDGRSIVDVGEAKWCDWCEDYPDPIVTFRVTKEHKEPREFWVKVWNGGVSVSEYERDGYIHVREVTKQ